MTYYPAKSGFPSTKWLTLNLLSGCVSMKKSVYFHGYVNRKTTA